MRAVAVRRLTLRVPSGRLAASRQRAEDALFLSAPDETRLVILRRLELGRLSADAGVAAWTERAARTLAERRARAVHGARAGAENADAVWFRSVDEARSLLLLLLASGRFPAAWFWPLAVPDWQRTELAPWIAAWIRAADSDAAAAVALACAVVMAVRAGHASAILAALGAPSSPLAAIRPRVVAPLPATSQSVTWRQQDALAVMARHDAAARDALVRAISRAPPAADATVRLAHCAVLAVAPELAGQAPQALALARAMVAVVQGFGVVLIGPDPPGRQDEARAPLSAPRPPALPPGAADAPARRFALGQLPDAGEPEGVHHPESQATMPASARGDSPRLGAPAEPDAEQPSQGAGVLLAIRALDRLGLGAWSAAGPRHAADGFGRHLLCHIARRARLPPEDCLFAMLEAPDTMPDAVTLQTWRVGLDRWLRRRTRLRLADLARRRGWLLRVDTTLLVRFPMQAAELRLRRLALDIDPGWVPWLGLSVRYHFSDTALA
jgi:hypothetical protein